MNEHARWWMLGFALLGAGLFLCPAADAAVSWTDPTISTGVTPIRVVHIKQLRDEVDRIRYDFGFSTGTWTNPTLSTGTTPIRVVHMQELRYNIGQVTGTYTSVCPSTVPAISAWTDTVITTGVTPIRVRHITELRAAIDRIGTCTQCCSAQCRSTPCSGAGGCGTVADGIDCGDGICNECVSGVCTDIITGDPDNECGSGNNAACSCCSTGGVCAACNSGGGCLGPSGTCQCTCSGLTCSCPTGVCDDGNGCTEGESCNSGWCSGGSCGSGLCCNNQCCPLGCACKCNGNCPDCCTTDDCGGGTCTGCQTCA
jgi:hypothetical protein